MNLFFSIKCVDYYHGYNIDILPKQKYADEQNKMVNLEDIHSRRMKQMNEAKEKGTLKFF